MISSSYVDGLELRIKELTAERDALAVIEVEYREWITSNLNREAEIAKHSFRLGAEWAHTSPRESLLIAAENHANQLRRQAKGGE